MKFIAPSFLVGAWYRARVATGLLALLYLNASHLWLLELCLGVFIAAGGLSMSVRLRSWRHVSRGPFTWLIGLVGGALGGLFSASGPLLGWFAYSQPLSVAIIRATLLGTSF